MSDRPVEVIALSVDLMDRSKLSGAFPDARIVRSFDALVDAVEAVDDTTVSLVDLSRVGEPARLADVAGRVIAFGSHVDEELLTAAKAAGVEALPRSVFFRRLGEGSLL